MGGKCLKLAAFTPSRAISCLKGATASRSSAEKFVFPKKYSTDGYIDYRSSFSLSREIDKFLAIGQGYIAAGYAWHFKKYSSDIQLANAELKARKARLGLWADKFPKAPWDWRRDRKKGK